MDTLAANIHGPQTEQGVAWRLAYGRLHVDETGDLRQAEEYWRLAHENVQDAASKVRCELLRIRLLSRQGRIDGAREAARQLATRADLPRSPSLRLLVLLEELIQHGQLKSWQPLLAAAEAVEPASRRLMLLAELRRYPQHQAIPSSVSSALLALLPPGDAEGMDAALSALRLAEVLRVAGQKDEARRLLQQAERACRAPMRLAVLRQVYLANDRVGWDLAALQETALDELADPASGESPGLCGLTLLEHAERVVEALNDPERAAALLAWADVLLKPTGGLWAARTFALRARMAWLQGEQSSAHAYSDQATKGFLAVDNSVSAEALHRSLDSGAAADALSFAVPSSYDLPPYLDVRLTVDGRLWRVEFERGDGQRWAGEVPLEADFAGLFELRLTARWSASASSRLSSATGRL